MIKVSSRASIAVLGYGVEGQGTYEYLMRHGFEDVTIVDEREHLDLPDGAKAILGVEALQSLDQFSVIFRSPGIYRRHPAIIEAERQGSIITSQVEYFLSKAPCTVIGVTGTKGKSTTTSLLYHILQSDGRDVYLAGNIGVSLIGLLDEVSVASIVVLELSSFQLQDIRVSPRIAIVLGITIEHQDVHASLSEYVQAKAGIASHQLEQDFLLCAPDNELTREVVHSSASQNKWSWCVGGEDTCELPPGAQLGAFSHEGMLFVKHTHGTSPLVPLTEIPLMGEHMLHNVLPAVVAGALLGVSDAQLASALRSFSGVPHRMEYVGETRGMHFYNDSAATTPEAAIAGIAAHAEYPTAIILGGGQKGVSLKELASAAAQASHLQHIFLLGVDAAQVLKAELSQLSPHATVHHVLSMRELETILLTLSEPGLHVVLSPGCSSFDLFSDYKARGEALKSLVVHLSEEGKKK